MADQDQESIIPLICRCSRAAEIQVAPSRPQDEGSDNDQSERWRSGSVVDFLPGRSIPHVHRSIGTAGGEPLPGVRAAGSPDRSTSDGPTLSRVSRCRLPHSR
jgi:hypothetical protein